MSANVPQILAEDENTYTLANPAGGAPVRVAKTPGIVAMMKASAPAPAAAAAAPIEAAQPSTADVLNLVAPSEPPFPTAAPAAPQPAGPRFPQRDPAEIARQAQLAALPPAARGVATPTAPQQPEEQKSADPKDVYFHPVGTAPAGTQVIGGASDFGEKAALKKIDEGENERAAAIASEGADTGKILHDAGAAADALKTTSDAKIGENQGAIDLAQKAVDTYKIDRNRLWNSKDTGQKIKAGISIMLGAIGQGLGGGPNEGIRAIDEAIARDVADQQDALASKKGAVEALQKKGIDMERLAALHTAALWQAADHKIAERVAMAKGPEAIAAAKAASGEIHMKYAEARQALAERMALAQEKIGATAGGKPLPAEQAAKLGDMDASGQSADALLSEWRDKASFLGWLTRSGRQYNDARHLAAQTIGYGLEGGKLTDADVARYEAMLPTNTDSGSTAVYKIQQLKDLLERKRAASTKVLTQAGYSTPAAPVKVDFKAGG